VLTNALRYASDHRVALRVTRRPEMLEVVAENRAHGAEATNGSGLGLLGMAERVGVHGGALVYGRDGNIFRLAAQLPIPASVPA
jgi:signal transduction histidine kinase